MLEKIVGIKCKKQWKGRSKAQNTQCLDFKMENVDFYALTESVFTRKYYDLFILPRKKCTQKLYIKAFG